MRADPGDAARPRGWALRDLWDVAFAPDVKSAYVTDSGDGTVSVINVAQGSVTGSVPVSRIPTGTSAPGCGSPATSRARCR